MTKHFTFPTSIQSDLFNYLKPEQQEAIKPILRVLKKPAQEELCCSLLDYMEQGEATPPADLTLAAIYLYLTHEGLGEDMDKAIIKPLTPQSYRSIYPSNPFNPCSFKVFIL